MDACLSRAGERRSCVFADMSRGFDQNPDLTNTAENGSRCASDRFSHIGVACWKAGALEICNVGCGQQPSDAMREARERCEAKHQKTCEITGVQPIQAP
jgi:hypothetical protein